MSARITLFTVRGEEKSFLIRVIKESGALCSYLL